MFRLYNDDKILVECQIGNDIKFDCFCFVFFFSFMEIYYT